MKKTAQLIVALDTGSLEEAQRLVRELSGCVKFFKIGSQLFTACGPRCAEMVLRENAEVFLDLKFHDIPNTVAQAAISALKLGVFMFNVHAFGASVMLAKVMETLNKEVDALKARRPLVVGVTVLTSMDRQQLNSVGIMRSVKNEVIHLAKLCKKNGLDGVVCSGKEISLLRRVIGDDFVLVVPGIRPSSAAADDQIRIVTPADAARMGADYIVVGRPVVAAESPLRAAQEIIAELRNL